MTLRIVESAITAEQCDHLHEARLLLLLRHQATRGDGTINGITKLAKMDFLLRYPVFFERVVNQKYKRPWSVVMRRYERDTVESRMIRFRYGPWDPRYRRWIGLLMAKDLADTFVRGRTVYVKLKERGLAIADQISHTDEFADIDARAEQVCRAVGTMSGTALKDMIYEVVPELTGMAWGEEIDL